jgi:hypothetical protein
MVCVHQDGSWHWARNASISWPSSWPDSASRGRSSKTVSRQYSAYGEPPWYSAVSALAVTSARPSPVSMTGSLRPMK